MSLAPSEMCLLLRADAEQRWLHREVIPVLHELEERSQFEAQDASTALVYLEAMWSEATIRARATDAAQGQLPRPDAGTEETLHDVARRYHAAVRVLRQIVATRVARHLQPTGDREVNLDGHAGLPRTQAADGCAPRAA